MLRFRYRSGHSRTARQAIRSALLAATAVCAAGTAGAAGFDQFIGFGDSTMDSGYFRYGTTGGLFQLGATSARAVDLEIASAVAAGASGAFVGPGVVSTQLLAARFGLSALPVTLPGGNGTNFANGSAQTVSTTPADGYLNGFFNNVPTVAQISNYLGAVHNRADPSALYMINTGANDLFWMQTQQASLVASAAPGNLHEAVCGHAGRQRCDLAGRRRAHLRGAQSQRIRQAGPGGRTAHPVRSCRFHASLRHTERRSGPPWRQRA